MARNGKVYWYDTFRVGSDVRKAYVGEDNDEIRARLARHGELAARRAEAQAARARTIRILRAEGFLGVDGATGALLNAFAQAGVFRLGGTLVGTQAFRLYEGELGLRYEFDQTAQTDDIDIASFERLSPRARRRGVAAAAIDPEGFFFRTRAAACNARSLAMAPDARRSPGRVPDAEL